MDREKRAIIEAVFVELLDSFQDASKRHADLEYTFGFMDAVGVVRDLLQRECPVYGTGKLIE